MKNSKKAAAALFSYCAIVVGLLAMTPWIDWSEYGSIWVATLAALPVVPGIVIASPACFRKMA